MQPGTIPFYLDWSFWAVFISVLALILSQLPPIKQLIKGAKLDLEIYSNISITHKLGNPNIQLHLIISNIGGKRIRVRNVSVSLYREEVQLGTYPAQNYLQNQSDKSTVLFTTFSLKPSEEWAHITNFLNYFKREDELKYQKIENDMISDFRSKKSLIQGEPEKVIELDQALVPPAVEFFENKFLWKPGEYYLDVSVNTEHESADISKRIRFTLFESHTEQLMAIKDYFKYGGGLWWTPDIQVAVIVPVKEA